MNKNNGSYLIKDRIRVKCNLLKKILKGIEDISETYDRRHRYEFLYKRDKINKDILRAMSVLKSMKMVNNDTCKG